MAKRLTKEARRAQLLDVAYAIIRRDGTDALTLARLAEQAGVSKPIAYDHFGTRAGLLAALFRSFDAKQVEHLRALEAASGDSPDAAAQAAAAGYLECQVDTGPEYEELCAALLAFDETKDLLAESRTTFAAAFRQVFAPYADPSDAVLTALVGAAEALSREEREGTLTKAAAVTTLAQIMRSALATSTTGS